MMNAALAISVDAALQGASDQSFQKLSCITRHSVRPFAEQPSEGWMAKTADADTRTKADSSDWLNNKRNIAKKVRLALVSDFDHLKAPRKEIARKADCSPRTVEAWTDPEVPTVPGLEHFLRLVPHSPAIQKMLLGLMTLDADLDPKAYAMFLEFMRMVQR